MTRLLLALFALRAVDAWYDMGPAGAVLWVAACAAPLVHRRGWLVLATVAVGCWAFADWEMRSNHVILVAWISLIMGLFDGEDRVRLLRWQAVVVYLFATVNKLNPVFLGGHVLALSRVPMPLVPMSVAAVLTEAFMAWAVWCRQWVALPVGVALHLGITVTMGNHPVGWLMLASFNGTMLVLVWVAHHEPDLERPLRLEGYRATPR